MFKNLAARVNLRVQKKAVEGLVDLKQDKYDQILESGKLLEGKGPSRCTSQDPGRDGYWFGRPLDPDGIPVVPTVLSQCFDYLLHTGLNEEGIFRKSGNTVEVEALKMLFDTEKGDIDLTGFNVHTIASLVKMYLRTLPEPLLTFALYDEFIKANDEPDESKTAKLKGLMEQLPPRNAAILRFLFRHLKKFQSHSPQNMMTSTNLAIVFGPNLLRGKEENYIQVVLHSPLINSIVQTMIEQVDSIFAQDLLDLVEQKQTTIPELTTVISTRKLGFVKKSLYSIPAEPASTPDDNKAIEERGQLRIKELQTNRNRRRANCRSVGDISNVSNIKEGVNTAVSELQEQLAELWVKLESEQRDSTFQNFIAIVQQCLNDINVDEADHKPNAETEEISCIRKGSKVITLLDQIKGLLFQLKQCISKQERMKSYIEINRTVFRIQTETEKLKEQFQPEQAKPRQRRRNVARIASKKSFSTREMKRELLKADPEFRQLCQSYQHVKPVRIQLTTSLSASGPVVPRESPKEESTTVILLKQSVPQAADTGEELEKKKKETEVMISDEDEEDYYDSDVMFSDDDGDDDDVDDDEDDD